MQIFWLKRNLRLQDSEPFFQAMKSFRRYGKVLPLYCHEPSLIDQPDASRQHQLFVKETLDELDNDLKSIGGSLLQVAGETVDVLKRIHQIQPITRIWTHRETTQNSQFDRDRSVISWCKQNGVQLMEVAQNGIARGFQSSISFPDYFAQSVQAELKNPMGTDLSARFADLPFPSSDPSDIPVAQGVDKPLRQKGGRSEALKNLQRFFTIGKIKRYPYQISSPNTAWEGCSRISTYLAYGVISDREVFQAVDRAVTQAYHQMDEWQFQKFQENARFFLDRMSWRRQYMQTFETHPDLEFECMLPEFNGIRESEYNPELFEAWKEGRTGFPYIDAAIRCLNQTGWINMRLRATIVSFATMNLWIPTTKVAKFLAQEFLDYEPGIHHVIHQLIAGTTSFSDMMVYDPVKQGLDHDKDGIFIKRWVPELADLPSHEIHSTQNTQYHLAPEAEISGHMPYPAPIVDQKETAKLAKERIYEIKNGFIRKPTSSRKNKMRKKEIPGQQSLF